MVRQLIPSARQPRWTFALTVLILVSLIMPWSLAAGTGARPSRVQSELLAMAAQDPAAWLPVIVQKNTPDKSVEARVAALGGTLTRDLAIINGFAAMLPGRAVPALADLAGVRWVSLDAPTESHSEAQNRYYLYSSTDDLDTHSQPILPVSQVAPPRPTLHNYDNDRDSAPGLTLLRGGTVDSAPGQAVVQHWRLGPFEDDMSLTGTPVVQLHFAVKDFQKDKWVKLWAHLVHVDAAGQPVGVIASASVGRKAVPNWQAVQIRFGSVQEILHAGEHLDIVLTVDPDSEADLWIAFGAKRYPAFLKANLQYALLTATSFYLANNPIVPVEDTTAQPLLPFSYQEPQVETLYNYDLNRDANPGLTLQRGGTATSDDPLLVQRWRFKPFRANTQLAPNAELELHAAVKYFQARRYGKIWAYLIDRDAAGNVVQVIASGYSEAADWGMNWQRRRIAFENPTYALGVGHQLELAIAVDTDSAQSMWLAYGSTHYPSRLKASFWALLPQSYLETIGAPKVWSQGYQGQGVRVAVIDSGIQADEEDFSGPDGVQSRIVHSVSMVTDSRDQYGHGTFIAGIIGGNGAASGGYYKGVAPQVDLINVRVSNEWGAAYESAVVDAMQWVLQHKDEHNIRVVNLSLNSSIPQSYHTSPLDAAAEILWFNGIVVVVSVGNNAGVAPGVLFPPANDPFVIAVGSTDDMETPDPVDDTLAASFSVFGETPEGIFRPDLAAPGVYIVSALASGSNFKALYENYHRGALDRAGNLVKQNFVASGTSISAGVVSGATALLLQAAPGLNPDQVKYLLMNSATPLEDEPGAGAGIVNIARAVASVQSYASLDQVPAINTGYRPSTLLTTGSDPLDWSSVNWNSVNWNSVNWNSVNWNSVNWNSTDHEAGAAAVQKGGRILQPPLILGDLNTGEGEPVATGGDPDRVFLPLIRP